MVASLNSSVMFSILSKSWTVDEKIKWQMKDILGGKLKKEKNFNYSPRRISWTKFHEALFCLFSSRCTMTLICGETGVIRCDVQDPSPPALQKDLSISISKISKSLCVYTHIPTHTYTHTHNKNINAQRKTCSYCHVTKQSNYPQ